MMNDNTADAVGHTHQSVTDYSTRLYTNSEKDESVTPSDRAPIPRAQQMHAGHLSSWRADEDTRTAGFSSEGLSPRERGW
jgi:hypothetical protein